MENAPRNNTSTPRAHHGRTKVPRRRKRWCGICNAVRDTEEAQVQLRLVESILDVSKEEWDACWNGQEVKNPFLKHQFLSCLERSGSVGKRTGWQPKHLVAHETNTGKLLACMPMYLKSHSYGEYVFDHSWASAYFQYGGQNYYPKLQSCVPFTPATGNRLLVRNSPDAPQIAKAVSSALPQVADALGVSSLHITFNTQEEWEELKQAGFLQRIGMQYHWKNNGYHTFDDFLGELQQKKRKSIRQERKKVTASSVEIRRLTGGDIQPKHWDAFYSFYRNTTDRKWGQAYLSRDFFHLVGEEMADDVLLVVATEDDEIIAGALNFIGEDCLFGRNWGCKFGDYYKFLHFELCYYQAIEYAIEKGLPRVEAGAQGEHKIQRGYLPTATYSSHYFTNQEFQNAVARFLHHETRQMMHTIEILGEASPFK